MPIYIPNLLYLTILTGLVILFVSPDFKPNLNRFDMKKLWAWLMLRPFDMVFLMRLRSIEKHIRLAVDNVSFDMLNAAKERIRIELQYRHSKKEKELINELAAIAGKADEFMKAILIAECQFGL